MSQSGKSVWLFGLYLTGLGLVLILVPNLLITLFGMPATNEVWIRIVGVLALALSAYYIVTSKHNLVPLLKASVYVRGSVILFFTAFVLAKLVSPMLILFGAVDLMSAIWTYFSLKKENAW